MTVKDPRQIFGGPPGLYKPLPLKVKIAWVVLIMSVIVALVFAWHLSPVLFWILIGMGCALWSGVTVTNYYYWE